MDLFKISNNGIATAYDFYDTRVSTNSKFRNRDKRMLHKLSRTRLKRLTQKEVRNIFKNI